MLPGQLTLTGKIINNPKVGGGGGGGGLERGVRRGTYYGLPLVLVYGIVNIADCRASIIVSPIL